MKRRIFLGTALTGLFTSVKSVLATVPESPPILRGKIYEGPEVTQIFVSKATKKMYLLHKKEILKKYNVKFGFDPIGHKVQEGDGRTPEGVYTIDRRNYHSSFYLSLGISYPNANDIMKARELGVSPGGNIFIHGGPNKSKSKRERKRAAKKNWTAGCISVSDIEMQEIFWMVRVGIPIYIKA